MGTNYCMPDGINTEQEHIEYLIAIDKISYELFVNKKIICKLDT